MTMPARKQTYTYADCLEWPEDVRAELIEGDVYMMTPPATKHQRISRELLLQIGSYLRGKRCEVFSAPFGVRLFEQENDTPSDVTTMVEPDLVVVCDPSKLDDHGCKGAPDMVVEILSPSNRRHDCVKKMHLYQRAGVKEYWLVDPAEEFIMVFLLAEDGVYSLRKTYTREDAAKVNVLEDCQIDLTLVFPQPEEP